MISGVPVDVAAAAKRLSFSTAVMVNLGVARDDISDAHISYVYDEDVIFPRLNFPHLLSPGNVPQGAGSIQVELYFSDRYRPLRVSPESLIDVVIADLVRIGVLRETDQILVREARLARYANVIYDHDRAAAVETIHGYLDDVRYCLLWAVRRLEPQLDRRVVSERGTSRGGRTRRQPSWRPNALLLTPRPTSAVHSAACEAMHKGRHRIHVAAQPQVRETVDLAALLETIGARFHVADQDTWRVGDELRIHG